MVGHLECGCLVLLPGGFTGRFVGWGRGGKCLITRPDIGLLIPTVYNLDELQDMTSEP
jgi:hypothetical protein